VTKALGILFTFFFVRWLFGVASDSTAKETAKGVVFPCALAVKTIIGLIAVGFTGWMVYLLIVQVDYWFVGFLAFITLPVLIFFPRPIEATNEGLSQRRVVGTSVIPWSDVISLIHRRGPQTYTVKSSNGTSIMFSPFHADFSQFRTLTEERTGLRYIEKDF
jgi:hypothetical protein